MTRVSDLGPQHSPAPTTPFLPSHSIKTGLEASDLVDGGSFERLEEQNSKEHGGIQGSQGGVMQDGNGDADHGEFLALLKDVSLKVELGLKRMDEVNRILEDRVVQLETLMQTASPSPTGNSPTGVESQWDKHMVCGFHPLYRQPC